MELGPNHTYKLRNHGTNKLVDSLINADRLKLYHNDPVDLAPLPRVQPDPPPAPAPTEAPAPPAQGQQPTDPHENIPEQPNIATQPDPATPDQNAKQQPKPNVKVKPKPQGTVPNPDEFFEIEKLLKQKRITGKNHSLVKWKDGSANTWEPEDNVSKPAIKHFYSTHTRKGKPRKRKGFKFFKKSNEAEQQ